MQPLTQATRQFLSPVRVGENDFLRLELSKKKDKFHAHLFSSVKNHAGKTEIRFPSWHTHKWSQRFVERKEVQVRGSMGLVLEIPVTDYTCELIKASWPKERLFASKEAMLMYQYNLLTGTRLDMNAKRTAEFKETKKVPNHNLEMSPELKLAPYQQIGLINSMNAEGYQLFMEQGTGKTAVVIARVCNEAKNRTSDDPYRAIIVCPKNVRLNWVNEFKRFATQPGKITVLRGGQMERLKSLINSARKEEGMKYSIVVCSYEAVSNTWDIGLGMVEWDLAVLDESHYIKSERTNRFKGAKKLRDKSKARMCLTGTPITNTAFDLFTQFEFIGEGWSGFSSYKAFRNFFGKFQTTKAGVEQLQEYENLPFLQERMARMSFIIRKEEALPDLPDKVRDVVEVTMGTDQRKAYESLRDTLVAEIGDELEEPNQLTVNSILTQMLRLAQITSGHMPFDAEVNDEGEVTKREIMRFDPNPKIEATVEMLKEKGPNDKTLIWCCFQQDIKTLSTRLRLEGIDHVTFYGGTSDAKREDAERRFNCDKECKVFIGNPAAGGTGLNLLGYPPGEGHNHTTNANHIIYFSQNWSATARSQSEDRAHRRGTREHVRITDLVVDGTIDTEIRDRVVLKRAAAFVISDLKKILSSIISGEIEKNGG